MSSSVSTWLWYETTGAPRASSTTPLNDAAIASWKVSRTCAPGRLALVTSVCSTVVIVSRSTVIR